ncbi:uncharacterized protein [Rutidosis leptorrhynchoides]|uniref:uncharacterized protein n=1 Tax=Rutidosis leptorrhynchoides TaxID=125765 RepID=UPI003A9A1B33
MANWLGCKLEKFSFSYLGQPIGGNMKRVKEWDPVVCKFNKRLADWKTCAMSFGGRLTLVKSVLSSLPLYFFSLFRAPSCVVKKLEVGRAIDALGIDFSTSLKKLLFGGSLTLFWEESWCGNSLLKYRFSRLYRIAIEKEARVSDLVQRSNNELTFSWNWSRTLTGRLVSEVRKLEEEVAGTVFKSEGTDS